MNREEAYKEMLDGKKITHKEWSEGKYAYYLSGDFYFRNIDPTMYLHHKGMYHEDGYKIYKKTVKKEFARWINVFANGSTSTFSSKEDADLYSCGRLGEAEKITIVREVVE